MFAGDDESGPIDAKVRRILSAEPARNEGLSDRLVINVNANEKPIHE